MEIRPWIRGDRAGGVEEVLKYACYDMVGKTGQVACLSRARLRGRVCGARSERRLEGWRRDDEWGEMVHLSSMYFLHSQQYTFHS